MAYLPNLQALKDLSNISIDNQGVQQVGNQVFNYSGDPTPEYQAMCAYLTNAISQLVDDANTLAALVPSFGK